MLSTKREIRYFISIIVRVLECEWSRSTKKHLMIIPVFTDKYLIMSHIYTSVQVCICSFTEYKCIIIN